MSRADAGVAINSEALSAHQNIYNIYLPNISSKSQ